MTEEQRYQALEQEKQNALSNSNKTYEDLLNKNTEYSQGVKDYLDQYQKTQNDIYDKQTAFNVALQEQNKQKAEQEYQKEATASKNAYYDFINPYGVQAEIQAQNGLKGSGYSETTKSQAWTTQQNRTAQAKASMNDAKLQFDNAIKEAYLNNDVNKANLALQILQQQQEEALRNFNYVSDTKQNQLSNNQNLDSDYNNRYNTLYSQIQQEKATQEAIRQWEAEMAEQQRQYNESMAYKREQDRIAQEQWEKEYALSKYKTYSSESSGGTALTGSNDKLLNSNNSMSYTDSNGNIVTTSSDGKITVSKAQSSSSNNTSNRTVTAMSSPTKFSSNTAKDWFNKNISGKKFTESDLGNLLSKGRSSKKINDSDIDRILKTYGL